MPTLLEMAMFRQSSTDYNRIVTKKPNTKRTLRPVTGRAQMREVGSDADWFWVEFLVYYHQSVIRAFGYVRREDGTDIADGVYQATLEGARLPVGKVTITWESHVTDAKVKFAQGGDVLATADGQWVNRPGRYQRDEYVCVQSSNGSRLLREIHFAGLDRTLVFRNSS